MTIQEDAEEIIRRALKLQNKIQNDFSNAGLMTDDSTANKAYNQCEELAGLVMDAAGLTMEDWDRIVREVGTKHE